MRNLATKQSEDLYRLVAHPYRRASAMPRIPIPVLQPRYGWGFRNFSDTVFSWDVYSHSFFGVPLDSDGIWLSATFDKLFYEQAFRKPSRILMMTAWGSATATGSPC